MLLISVGIQYDHYMEYCFSFEVRNKLNMKNIYNTSYAEEVD